METKIRYAKDEQLVFQKSGNIDAAKIAQQKVKRLQQEYYKFSRDCGLQIHKDRASVSGFKFV